MKRILKMISAPALCALGVIVFAPRGAQAAEYCAQEPSVIKGCGFSSLEQCRASVSGTAGTCALGPDWGNTAMAYQPRQPATRGARASAKRSTE
ncbi:DUF3551 domain-containing protein [Bradyrhizobium septentrionale]|uniref:DUF3551 domain-containing protein n=1 Tax=Bradyrhizobium septentrionale TaxID=1404411 RepID=A0A973ZZM9_9BRAD|nr:DUF3551 domain-containing protein [Bradyrhizobium septentrionale]UGY19914.1 DUF3551 domain-containing protein [Bradyrhizobium septentrionale]UGY28699.1 DUF3551 domain-containing protein [Bradyrhizobium septentrionale]